MPRAKVALNGFSQAPDEHGGQPRVARLINARMGAVDRVEKSPGTIAMPTAVAPDATLVPVAYGLTPSQIPFVVSRHNRSIQNGARVLAAEHGASGSFWVDPDESKSFITWDEAARSEPIFTSEQYSYNSPGVMDLGTGDYVVVAEGLRQFAGYGVGTFLDSDLQWALVTGGDMKVKAKGFKAPSTPINQRVYPVTAGPYVVAWVNLNTIGIFGFQYESPMGLVQLAFVTTGGPALGAGTQIDASYDWATERLIIVGPSAQYWWLDTSSWALLQSGAFVFTPINGTMGCSVTSGITTGLVQVAYRSSATNWMHAAYIFTDSSVTQVSAPTLIYISTNALTASPSFAPWRAGVKSWANSGWLRPEGAMVTIYHEPLTTDAVVCTSATLAVRSNGVVDRICFHSFGSHPASKPYYRQWDATPLIPVASLWCYQGSGRTMRGAVHLTEGSTAFTENPWAGNSNYPRATHWAFRGAQPGPAPLERSTGAVNAPIATTSGLGGKAGILTAMCVNRYADANADAVNVYLVTHAFADQILGKIDRFLPDILQQAHGNDSTIFATSNPDQYNGQVSCPGAQYLPRNPIITHPAAGSTPAAGKYLYVTVREWIDSAGNVYRSPPSDPVSITNATAGTNLVSVYDDPWENRNLGGNVQFNGAMIKVYRTTNNGTVFYNINGSDGVFLPSGMIATPVTDAVDDAGLIRNEILYTQGERGGNSGMLEWWGPPPCRSLWRGSDRMIAGGLENEHRVQLSNLFYDGEQISWPENPAYYVQMAGIVNAVSALDTYYLAFCSDGIYLITGQGPDSFGVGTFDTPRKLTERITAPTWRSIVETPEGIMFQAFDGQIYIVQRGTFQVIQKSQAIHDSVGRAPSSIASPSLAGQPDVYDPTNWVMGAVYDSFENEVWFFQQQENAWVYQLDYGAWREEVSIATMGKYAIGAGLTRVVSAGTSEPTMVVATIRTASSIPTGYRIARRSDTDTLGDYLGSCRFMTLTTNDIDLVHGRLKRIWVRTTVATDQGTPNFIASKISVWYDGKLRNLSADDTGAFTPSGYEVNSNFLELEHAPARQKCNQFRFAWSDNPLGVGNRERASHVISLDVEYEPAASGRGSIRYNPGTGRMT